MTSSQIIIRRTPNCILHSQCYGNISQTKEAGKGNLCLMFHIQVCKVNFMEKKSNNIFILCSI